VTGDANDFEFLPDGATNDNMYIAPGRANLGINELDCSSTCTYLPNNLWNTSTDFADITVPVRAGASSIVIGVLSSITAVAFLAF